MARDAMGGMGHGVHGSYLSACLPVCPSGVWAGAGWARPYQSPKPKGGHIDKGRANLVADVRAKS